MMADVEDMSQFRDYHRGMEDGLSDGVPVFSVDGDSLSRFEKGDSTLNLVNDVVICIHSEVFSCYEDATENVGCSVHANFSRKADGLRDGFEVYSVDGLSSSQFERGVYSSELVNGVVFHTVCSEVRKYGSFRDLEEADKSVLLYKLEKVMAVEIRVHNPYHWEQRLVIGGHQMLDEMPTRTITCSESLSKCPGIFCARCFQMKGKIADYLFINMSNRGSTKPLSGFWNYVNGYAVERHCADKKAAVLYSEIRTGCLEYDLMEVTMACKLKQTGDFSPFKITNGGDQRCKACLIMIQKNDYSFMKCRVSTVCVLKVMKEEQLLCGIWNDRNTRHFKAESRTGNDYSLEILLVSRKGISGIVLIGDSDEDVVGRNRTKNQTSAARLKTIRDSCNRANGVITPVKWEPRVLQVDDHFIRLVIMVLMSDTTANEIIRDYKKGTRLWGKCICTIRWVNSEY